MFSFWLSYVHVHVCMYANESGGPFKPPTPHGNPGGFYGRICAQIIYIYTYVRLSGSRVLANGQWRCQPDVRIVQPASAADEAKYFIPKSVMNACACSPSTFLLSHLPGVTRLQAPQ